MKYVVLFFISFLIGIGAMIFILNSRSFQPSKPSLSPSIKPSPFLLEKAPSKSLRGKIVSMSGDIGWQSRVATEPAALKEPRILQQGEELVTGDDGEATVEFSTVSMTVAPETKISFIQTLPESIVLSQPEGIVTYANEEGKNFSMKSMHLLVQLNEGVIDVSVDKETHFITIDVQKGSITTAFNDLEYKSTVETTEEGQRFVFNDDERVSSIE